MEREEFADFYAESFQRLVGQLYAMIGDQCEAQDAVQEADLHRAHRPGLVYLHQHRSQACAAR